MARHDLGRMDVPCHECGALHWMDEKTQRSSKAHPKFGTCCNHGKIKLPALEDPPTAIQPMYLGSDPRAQEFRENIRQYNMAFAFTSIGITQDNRINNGTGPWVFRIQGALHH
jgi:hypothetical protein